MRTQVIRKCISLGLSAICAAAVCQTTLAQTVPGSLTTGTGGAGNNSTATPSTSSSPGGTTNISTGPTSTAGTAAETFIGANATQAFVGGAREAAGQQFQAFQAAQTQANTQSQQSGTSREVRTVLRIGFKFPTASAAQQTGSLASANSLSLSRFSQNRPELAGVNVSLNGDGTAVLTGSLPTIESSRLAANLMRIQPGVRKIDNQIAVIQ